MSKVVVLLACVAGAVALAARLRCHARGCCHTRRRPTTSTTCAFRALGIPDGRGDVFDAMWAGLRRHLPFGLLVGAVLAVAAWPAPGAGPAAAMVVGAMLGVAVLAAAGTMAGLLISVILGKTGVARGAWLDDGSLLLGLLGLVGAAGLTLRGALAATRSRRATDAARRIAALDRSGGPR